MSIALVGSSYLYVLNCTAHCTVYKYIYDCVYKLCTQNSRMQGSALIYYYNIYMYVRNQNKERMGQ